MEHFPDGKPVKDDLDAIVGDRPVFLFNRDVHGAWVSSAALRRAGIDAATPDPADGRIERDADTGEPTGLLHEGAAYTFEATQAPPPVPGRMAGRDPHRAGAPALAGHHRLAGRVGHAGHARRLPRSRRRRPPHRAGRRRAVVGPAPRAGADHRVPGAARTRHRPPVLPDDGQDHGRRDRREPDRRAARAVLRRLRRPHRQPRLDLRRRRAAGRRGHRARRAWTSRCTCTRSATAPCASRSTPSRRRRRRTGRRDNRHHIAHLQVVQPDDIATLRRTRRHRQLPDVLGAERAADDRAHASRCWATSAPALQYPFGDLLRGRRAVGHGQRLGRHDRRSRCRSSRSRSPGPIRANATPHRSCRAVDPPVRGDLRVHRRIGLAQPRRGRRWHHRVGRRADLAVLDVDILGGRPAAGRRHRAAHHRGRRGRLRGVGSEIPVRKGASEQRHLLRQVSTASSAGASIVTSPCEIRNPHVKAATGSAR